MAYGLTANNWRRIVAGTLLMLAGIGPAKSQGTAFTYQGKLSDNGTSASGQYDLTFSLFDTPTVGTGLQHGATLSVPGTTVTAGIFSVSLDFGPCPGCFDGTPRFLEMAVKRVADATYSTIGPRQAIAATPYAIRSLFSAGADSLGPACVNCVTSGQIASVAGSAVSGLVPVASVPPGSPNYIQNTANPQPGTDFNIAGTGRAGTLDVGTQYNFSGQRVLGVTGTAAFPNSNVFLGIGSGAANTGGVRNTFVGASAGASNTNGTANSFFGALAGQANILGGQNSFFGRAAGMVHQSGSDNAFFGAEAGAQNTSSLGNAFFGAFAGLNNVTGSANTMLGYVANVGSGALTNATAIGNRAFVTQSDSLVLGSIAGVNAAAATVNVGIGTTAPAARLHVAGDTLVTGSHTVNGTLTGNAVNAAMQYNLGGARILAGDADNVFGGIGAGAGYTSGLSNTYFGASAGKAGVTSSGNSFFGGAAGEKSTAGFNSFFGNGAGYENTTGTRNAFFGSNAGQNNTTGSDNAFFGLEAGYFTSTGGSNSFFGMRAGKSNGAGERNSLFGFQAGLVSTGVENSFFGSNVGQLNTVGSQNAFFGVDAGFGNLNGSVNAFYGHGAGRSNTSGSWNTFVGTSAGQRNKAGSDNTFVGRMTDFDAINPTGDSNTLLGTSAMVAAAVSRSTAIGSLAKVTQNDSVVLGAVAGVNTATTSAVVGIGTTNPQAPLHVERDAAPASDWQTAQLRISGHSDGDMQLNLGYDTTADRGVIQAGHAHVAFTNLVLNPAGGNVGIGTTPSFRLHVNGSVAGVGPYQDISDARYKKLIQPIAGALDKVLRLRGVSYDWRREEFPHMDFADGRRIGLLAQEVRDVVPEAVAEDRHGFFTVAYSSLTPLLVEAIKQQHQTVARLQRENATLLERLEALEALARKLAERL